jgi:hypothetical protein
MGDDAMILRLSAKLNARIKAGTLATLALHGNPFADWSAGLFLVGRSPYILLTNTKSLYSTVLPGKGLTSESAFIESALRSIRESLEADGQGATFARFIAPASGSVRFAKALNRSVTASMNELTRHATVWLAESDLSPLDVGVKLNDILLSVLARSKSVPYGKPREAFTELSSLPASRPRSEGDDAGG